MCDNNVEVTPISESVLELQMLAAAECTCECCSPPTNPGCLNTDHTAYCY